MEERFNGLKRVVNAVLDTLFTLVLLLTVAAAIIVLLNQGVTNVGMIGVVQSPSMVASGLDVGDVVFATPQTDYAKGDVIVFYRAPTKYDGFADRKTLRSYEVWMHEVIDIKTDEFGRTTYLTKGSSNYADDKYYVPQDFVLGKAQELPTIVSGFIRFIASVQGIILTVIMPSAIMFVYLAWDLIMILSEDPQEEEEKMISPVLSLPKTVYTYAGTEKKNEMFSPQPPLPSKTVYTYTGAAGQSFFNAGGMQPLPPTFSAKLYAAKPIVKLRYMRIKKLLMAYYGAKSLVYQDVEYYSVNGTPFAVLSISQHKLHLDFFVSPKDKDNAKNILMEKKESPCHVSIQNHDTFTYATLLINAVANVQNFVRKNAVRHQ